MFSKLVVVGLFVGASALQLKSDTAKSVDPKAAATKAGVDMDKPLIDGVSGGGILDLVAQGSVDNCCCICRLIAGCGNCQCGFDKLQNIAWCTPAGSIVIWLQCIINWVTYGVVRSTYTSCTSLYTPFYVLGAIDPTAWWWEIMESFGLTVICAPSICNIICCPFHSFQAWCFLWKYLGTGGKSCQRSGQGDQNAWICLNCGKDQRDKYMAAVGPM